MDGRWRILMNLEWLAAVLEPFDIAPHPNFEDPNQILEPARRLAAVITGDNWRMPRTSPFETSTVEVPGDVVALAAGCFSPSTQASSVAALQQLLIEDPGRDPASATALALVTSTAAAEMDDYDLCLSVVNLQLDRLDGDFSPEAQLVRSALLAQKALRLADSGQQDFDLLINLVKALQRIKPAEFASFPVRMGIGWSSIRTVDQMRLTLTDSALSLIPRSAQQQAKDAGLQDFRQRLREPILESDFHVARKRSDIYERYVAKAFQSRYQTNTRTIGGLAGSDLFYPTLLLELAGSGSALVARKDLALLRFVSDDRDIANISDALRCLRQAGARTELDVALRHLIAAGPLEPLVRDARQILRQRTSRPLLRTVELNVLTVAADLLAPSEARKGFDAVMSSLRSGGPPNLLMSWQLDLLRKEAAWLAAASLARVAGTSDVFAQFLLIDARAELSDAQLLDGSLRRVVAQVDWEAVKRSARENWIVFLKGEGQDLQGTKETIFPILDEPLASSPDADNLEPLIYALNATMRGDGFPSSLRQEASTLVTSALRRIRDDARKHTFSGGGASPADIAAGLLVEVKLSGLWEELSDFLLDPAVAQSDKSPAFERLARWGGPLPAEVAARFSSRAQDLLASPGFDPFQESIVPYPPALRFLSRHQLIDRGVVLKEISMLAGSRAPAARKEASITVGLLSYAAPSSDLLPFALVLAGDDDAAVRANGGRSLASLSLVDDPLAVTVEARLIELLREDGVVTPRLVLRGLDEHHGEFSREVVTELSRLAEGHPSHAIRVHARILLRRSE
jgi:hypothetical protein